ncbi:MAG TPA: thioredoxin family protein [Candidatus Obscuribacterales bacterium]
MAPTRDGSTMVTPRALVALATVLLLARIAVSAYEQTHKVQAKSLIHWAAVTEAHPLPECKKPRLLKFYAEWSEPCRRLESTVLVNRSVGELIASHFEPFAVRDMVKEEGANTEYVTQLQKKYRVFAFPTLVVVAPNGEAVATLVGCSSALATHRFLARAASGRTAQPGLD